MEVLRHDNIVKFYEKKENSDYIQLIMELIEGVDLFEYVENNKSISEEKASEIMRELFEAVSYIHNSGIIHRDLKPENIMVEFDRKNEIKKVKIIDFGLSCYFHELHKETDQIVRCGTLNYSAPEIIDFN